MEVKAIILSDICIIVCYVVQTDYVLTTGKLNEKVAPLPFPLFSANLYFAPTPLKAIHYWAQTIHYSPRGKEWLFTFTYGILCES